MIRMIEGINDKNLFKAIFLAGGPGSGKSFIARNMFGFIGNLSPFGVKIIDSDLLFEIGLEKHNLPKIIQMDDEEIYQQQMRIRGIAKKLTKKKQSLWVNGMLPIIVDGTGKDYNKITKQAEKLKNIGYDVGMIFINTSLEVALHRNAERDRKVDPDLVKKMWEEVQKNMGKFQFYFENESFYIIDNNQVLEGEVKTIFLDELFMRGKKFIEKPLQNRLGKKIIEYLKNTGGKYLTDLPDGY